MASATRPPLEKTYNSTNNSKLGLFKNKISTDINKAILTKTFLEISIQLVRNNRKFYRLTNSRWDGRLPVKRQHRQESCFSSAKFHIFQSFEYL